MKTDELEKLLMGRIAVIQRDIDKYEEMIEDGIPEHRKYRLEAKIRELQDLKDINDNLWLYMKGLH